MAKPEVQINNYEAVYSYYAQLRPDLGHLQQKLAEFSLNFTADIFNAPDDIADQLDQLAGDNHRILLSMNHTHFIDQFPVAAAMHNGQLGTDMNTRPMSFLAKDEYFRMELRDEFDNMNAIPIFQPKHYPDHPKLGRAGLAAIEVAAQRVEAGQNLGAFWEGQRNQADVRRLQPLQAGLFRVIKTLGRKGVDWAILNVAVVHDNLDNPARTVVHVNQPLTDIPGKRAAEVLDVVQDDLQRAVNHAYVLLDKVTK